MGHTNRSTLHQWKITLAVSAVWNSLADDVWCGCVLGITEPLGFVVAVALGSVEGSDVSGKQDHIVTRVHTKFIMHQRASQRG